jgi:serine/threonine protein kinase
MSPEYVMFGQFSEKSDVYSFGVMVLEIVAGKKNISSHTPHHVADSLLSYVSVMIYYNIIVLFFFFIFLDIK